MIVVKEPREDCKGPRIDGFDFIGYEPLDKFHSSSALTNMGFIGKGYIHHQLNQFGLIDSFDKAYTIKAHLREARMWERPKLMLLRCGDTEGAVAQRKVKL